MFLIFSILFDNIFSSNVQAASFLRGGVDQAKCELPETISRSNKACEMKQDWQDVRNYSIII